MVVMTGMIALSVEAAPSVRLDDASACQTGVEVGVDIKAGSGTCPAADGMGGCQRGAR